MKENNMKAIKLIRIDFDTMENRNPIYKKTLGVFVDEKGKKAETKIKEFLKKTKVEKYRGYDGETYPQFKHISIKLK